MHLIHQLHALADTAPDRVAYRVWPDETHGWRAVRDRAAAWARACREVGVPGDRVLIAFPTGIDAITAFLGAIWAERVPVPTTWPARRTRHELARLTALADDATPVALCAPEPVSELGLPRLEPIEGALPPLPTDRPDALCFLQYSSGSTGRPRGVRITQANLVANLEQQQSATGLNARARFLCWLPLSHDMGLIGNVLLTLHLGAECTVMPPTTFLARPRVWLEAISTLGVTISGGPDFAFALCVARIKDLTGLDLSSWRVAFSGAEPVRAATLDAFATAFASCGFDPRALNAAYGLAENVVHVANGAMDQRPRVFRCDPAALAMDRIALSDTPDAVALVAHGPATHARQEARIKPPGGVGELWLRGPSVADGYWGGHSGERFADGWLRTRDRAAIIDGELVVLCRLDDLIVRRGRNLAPQDIELAAEAAHPRLRRGCAAAFQVDDQLVLAIEARPGVDDAAVARAARAAVIDAMGVRLDVVRLLPPRSLPKTTSGKVRRQPTARLWRTGALAGADVDRDVLGWIAARLGADFAPDASFAELGLDSAEGVVLLGELGEHLGQDLPTHLLYDHPTPRALAAALTGEARPPAEPAKASDPIAVIGVAARLPGADDFEAVARRLREGASQITPASRWPNSPDAPAWGGFLTDLDRFDAAFFGLTDRAAAALDPQQRLLLEASWRAFEDACLDPDALAGSPTGVFLGLGAAEYAQRTVYGADIDAWSGTGSSGAVASGRLAHHYGLTGPTLTVDTACSSSLVAIHLAVRSLRAGDCSLALAGGANVTLDPEPGTFFTRIGALSARGQCAAFTAEADGYVRAEGVGLLVLKPLARAIADGDRVHAVIEGTAINHDGRSNGLTAPNGRAQSAVIRAALADAGVAPGDVDLIEAHGTGTPLGDPVELAALGRVFEAATVHASKAIFGHTEAAAGVAGVLAGVCALRDGVGPQPGREAPTTAIEWGGLRLADGSERPRRLGVSSFGFSGTNAHLVLAAGPALTPPRPGPWLHVSARSEAAREAMLAVEPTESAGLVGRAALPWRAAWTVDGRVHRGHVPAHARRPRVVFICPGQGVDFGGVRALYDAHPAFREAFDACAAASPAPLLAALDTPPTSTAVVQPFSVAVALAAAAQWQAWGVEPDVVLGHSVGEIAAACLAGVFDGATAMRFATARGEAMRDVPGGMWAVTARPEQCPPGVEIAADNAPERLVLSGIGPVDGRALPVQHGFHSACVDPVCPAIAALAPAGRPPTRTIISTLTARPETRFDAAHWQAHARQPVRFREALAQAQGDVYIDLSGPLAPLIARNGHPVVSPARGLMDAAAQAWVRGVAVDRAALAGRGPRRSGCRHPFDRQRHWIERGGAPRVDTAGLVHTVRTDPAGGLIWTRCPDGPATLIRGGRYLVTGSLGGLGRALAERLHADWDARLVLLGARPLDAERAAFVTRLGAQFVQCDLTDPAARARARAAIASSLDGAFHLAGTVDPTRAMAVKRDALHDLAALAPRFWVLASSISAVIPGLERGIEAYAEANRALDAFARSARAQGRRCTSVALAPIRGVGLIAQQADALDARGIPALAPAEAVAGLLHALRADVAHAVVMRRPEPVAAGPVPDDLAEAIRRVIAKAARRDPAAVGDTDTLTELGIDSVTALDVVKDVETLVGRGLPTTFAYENDSLDAMRRALGAGTERDHVAPIVDDDGQGLALLPGQETFVVQRRFFPDMPGNVFLAVRVQPRLERAPLEAAVADVLDRHPVLGSVIRRVGGRYRQRIAAVRPVLEWTDVDLDLIRDATFDLEDGPLWRPICDGEWLALTGHHAIMDAWSQRNVLQDLLACYAARLAGAAPALPPIRTDWATAAAHLRRPGGGNLDWWQRRFAHGVPPIHLPWRAPVDAPSGGGSHAHRVHLDVAETRALEQRAAVAGVSLPALTLAAYMRALFDHSGQHAVTVRVAHARREARLPDVRRVVGAFADSLPIRGQVDVDEPIEALAARLQRELAEAQAHADASSMALAKLVDRGTSGPVGLTPAGFSFPLLPADPVVGQTRIVDVHGAAAAGFSRIGLIAWVFDGRLYLTLCAARSHLDDAQLAAFAETLQRALDPAPASGAPTLHGRILARCAAHPERIAVDTLTYRDLDHRSGAVAHRLLEHGPSRRIAVLGTPSAESVIALLAVLRSGAAYVPLDPHWPDARIAQILTIADPELVLSVDAHADVARRVAGDRPVITVGHDRRADGPDRPAEQAYVMFTSGSTGQPKGVMVRHAPHLKWQAWVRRIFGVTAADRFVQTASLGFGGSLRQIFTPLLFGGECHPVPRAVLRDPDALVAFIRDRGITIWNSVPSLWMHLMAAAERVAGEPFATVRWVLIGGEAVPADMVRRWRARYGDGCRLANLYGSTETIVNATAYEIVRDPPADDPHTPIGWARAGTDVYLLDVVDGIGEVAVGGAIADGYVNAPEQTEAAFVDHPEHGRLYRMGDLARMRPDGALVFMGRRDTQVQVRGNRVELCEIEHVLAEHPHVEQAVVVYRDDRLLATYEGVPTAAEDLRAFLRTRLPDYMVPHRLTHAATLPRNPAGKADRRALPSPAPATAPPSTSLLAQVAGAWQTVLGLPETPGPDADFFALGGDSIQALDVFDHLRPHLPADVRPMLLYRHSRLGALVGALAAAGAAVGVADPSPAIPAPRPVSTTPVAPETAPDSASLTEAAEALAHAARLLAAAARGPTRPPTTPAPAPAGSDAPLSEVQRGFWTADRAGGTPPNWCVLIPLTGAVDRAAFLQAVDWLLDRHPQLRTTFHATRHGPRQRTHPSLPVWVQLDDLVCLPDPTAALDARWAEDAAVRFDLEAGPLVRLRLMRLGPTTWQLLMTAHHIVTDAWSCWLMAGELCVAHDAFRAGRAPAVPPPPARYRDLIRPRPLDPWWADYLADLRQPAGPVVDGLHSATFSLDADAFERLRARARQASVSPFAWVLAAYAAALAEVFELDDCVVATALADRDGDSAAAGVVGAFARGLPVRIRDFAPKAVARSLGDALGHADASAVSLAGPLGPAALDVLGRFFLSWLDPRAVPRPAASIGVDWTGGRYRFAAASTRTEIMAGALVADGLHLNLHGGLAVPRVADAWARRLRGTAGAALIVYPPDHLPLPVSEPLVIETIDAPHGRTELVLLPISAGQLLREPDLPGRVAAAMRVTDAPVVALAGLLPALTGLAETPLSPTHQLTTGHAATVAAMVAHVGHVLERLGRTWARETVALVGCGAIGTAVFAACEARFGSPARVLRVDPRLGFADDPTDATLILGATSGGDTLPVDALRPGTVVIDDSFPPMFDQAAARRRMETAQDVLLIGGGQWDVGPLDRRSPLPGADAFRAQFPSAWLPGCHAEALLLAARPALGPTRGVVTVERAEAIAAAVAALGWRVPPLHLHTWRVPAALLQALT